MTHDDEQLLLGNVFATAWGEGCRGLKLSRRCRDGRLSLLVWMGEVCVVRL